MIKDINNITVPLETEIDEVVEIAIKKSGLHKNAVTGYKIKRRSVDARRKKVQFNYCISLFTFPILYLKIGPFVSDMIGACVEIESERVKKLA